MPDIQSPGKQLIYGKEPNEIGRLLSHITDSAEAAKQLKLLYSTPDMAAILNSGYLQIDNATDILLEAGFTTTTAAEVMSDSGFGGIRAGNVISRMSRTDGIAQMEDAAFTTAKFSDMVNNAEAGDIDTLRYYYYGVSRVFKVWTANGVGDLNTGRFNHCAAGISNTGWIVFGGRTASTLLDNCETADIASGVLQWVDWGLTAPPTFDMNTAVQEGGGGGSTMSYISCGGNTSLSPSSPTRTVTTETRFGVWSVEGDLNTAVFNHACAGLTADAAISFGGSDSSNVTRTTEKYNGTAWSNDADLVGEVHHNAGCGSSVAALCAGGGSAGIRSKLTQEYNGVAWQGQNDLNEYVGAHGMFGTQGNAMSFGGQAGLTSWAITAETEVYDGTSWSTSAAADMNTTRWYHDGAGGTQGIAAGGYTSASGDITIETEEFR